MSFADLGLTGAASPLAYPFLSLLCVPHAQVDDWKNGALLRACCIRRQNPSKHHTSIRTLALHFGYQLLLWLEVCVDFQRILKTIVGTSRCYLVVLPSRPST